MKDYMFIITNDDGDSMRGFLCIISSRACGIALHLVG